MKAFLIFLPAFLFLGCSSTGTYRSGLTVTTARSSAIREPSSSFSRVCKGIDLENQATILQNGRQFPIYWEDGTDFLGMSVQRKPKGYKLSNWTNFFLSQNSALCVAHAVAGGQIGNEYVSHLDGGTTLSCDFAASGTLNCKTSFGYAINFGCVENMTQNHGIITFGAPVSAERTAELLKSFLDLENTSCQPRPSQEGQ